MSRFYTALGLILIATAFVGMELYMKPGMFSDSSELSASQFGEIRVEEEGTTPPPTQPETERTNTPLPKSYFPVDTLTTEGVVLEQGNFGTELFHHATISPSKDSYFLVSFAFTDGENKMGTVTRIIPTSEMSAGRLMTTVREKLEATIPQEEKDKAEEAQISLSPALDTVGEANFYLNDKKEYPDTVFLVTRSGSNILAFEYKSEYHSQVKNFVPLFFE